MYQYYIYYLSGVYQLPKRSLAFLFLDVNIGSYDVSV